MNFWDYFFAKEGHVPEEYFWSLYDKGHLSWLLAIAIVCGISIVLFRKSEVEKQDRILKGLAIWIAIQEIIKDIVFLFMGTLGFEHMPLHICGISIFFTLWYAFKPGDLNGAYIYGVSLPGALAALIFCDWTELPIFCFSALNSWTIHAELVAFALMALASGRLKPRFKEIPRLTAVMVGMAIPIYFLNKAIDTNFMFINYPSPGSPLVPLYDIFGDFYVVAAVPLLVIIWVVLFFPWYVAERLRRNKAS